LRKTDRTASGPMSTQPTIYLFAAGQKSGIRTTLKDIARIMKGIGKDKPDMAFVGAASSKDRWLVYYFISNLIKAGCHCRIRRVILAPPKADLKKAREILRDSDAVFMSGGDVDIGMRILQEKNIVGFMQDLARQGKLFLGVSAGSIMMAKAWVRWRNPEDDSTAELFPCLGLVPVICDTHAEDDDWVELKTALRLEGHGAVGCGITSGACLKAYPDGRLEAEGGPVARYAFLKGKIERRVDLLPFNHSERKISSRKG
jgi:peptidase E